MYSYGHVLQYFYNAGMKGYSNKPMEPSLCCGLRFHGTLFRHGFLFHQENYARHFRWSRPSHP